MKSKTVKRVFTREVSVLSQFQWMCPRDRMRIGTASKESTYEILYLQTLQMKVKPLACAKIAR